MNIPTTCVVCGKCGRPAPAGQAKSDGWLVAQRINQPEGYLIIRCPDDVTDHARRLAGMKQQYYHEHKESK